MRFEVHLSNSTTQPYYWLIRAANNRVLASSETYVNKQDAINAAHSVKQNAGAADVYDHTQE
jgi:uncharacterized protein YegP (UPF0339 family)